MGGGAECGDSGSGGGGGGGGGFTEMTHSNCGTFWRSLLTVFQTVCEGMVEMMRVVVGVMVVVVVGNTCYDDGGDERGDGGG